MVRLFALSRYLICLGADAKRRTITINFFKIHWKQDERLPGGCINRPLAHNLVRPY